VQLGRLVPPGVLGAYGLLLLGHLSCRLFLGLVLPSGDIFSLLAQMIFQLDNSYLTFPLFFLLFLLLFELPVPPLELLLPEDGFLIDYRLGDLIGLLNWGRLPLPKLRVGKVDNVFIEDVSISCSLSLDLLVVTLPLHGLFVHLLLQLLLSEGPQPVLADPVQAKFRLILSQSLHA
jgi:hypothetical protein